jgi:hypothetical protein
MVRGVAECTYWLRKMALFVNEHDGLTYDNGFMVGERERGGEVLVIHTYILSFSISLLFSSSH